MFITFEGIDGSGKSTQAEKLRERMDAEGYEVVLLREPGGTPLSEEIRSLLLETGGEMDGMTELLLFSAARADLVRKKIKPLLQRGSVVLCDRFYDSTTAYQGGGREMADVGWLQELHRRVTENLTPDRTYYLEIPVEVAIRRRSQNQESTGPGDRMEEENTAFFERVAAAYRNLANEFSDRFRVLDGTRPVDELREVIWRDVSELRSR